MTDIAQIGFKADTSDLEKAVVKLNAIKPAAAGASEAAGKLAATVEGASAAIQNAAVAAAKAEASKAEAVLNAARASGKATKDEIAHAIAMKKQADAAYLAAKAQRDKTAADKAAVAAASKTEAAVMAVTEAYKRQSAAARAAFNVAAGARSPGGGPMPANDQMPNRFNTANIAAQFQDIGVTAAMGMNPMTIALQQGTQLSAILNTMENPLKGIQIALASVFNTVTLGTIAIVGLIAAGIQMVDWASTARAAINGVADAVEAVGPYVVGLAGVLTLLYAPAILNGLKSLVMWIAMTGTAAIKAGAQIAGAWLKAIGPIGWAILAMTAFITALNLVSKEARTVFGVDILDSIKSMANKAIGYVVGLAKSIINVLKSIPDNIKGVATESTAEIIRKSFDDALGQDYVGAISDLVGKATSDAAEQLRKLANGISVGGGGKKERGKTAAESYQDIIDGAERTIASLKAEQAALGLTSYAAAKLKYETDLLNEAQQKNINLTPTQRAQLGELAATMAATAESTHKAKEAIDFAKDATKGFVSDMRAGLKEGQSLWESFGNAVQNVLDKILDKLIDMSIDQMFQPGNSGSGIGSFLSDIAGWLFNAKGNAFGPQGVQKFANGGAFTNSVVSRPTLFAYANGGAFGVMGEAGPEAVMPLHRGVDGSLGVRVTNGGGQGVQVKVNIENNSSNSTARVKSQRQTQNGVELDVVIDDMVGSKVGERGSSIDRSLDARLNQQLIRR